jgi:hypothetical protein
MLFRGFAGLTALVLCLAGSAHGFSAPIVDEALRLEALQSVFPGMQISVNQARDAGKKSAPDALRGQTIYRIVGKAANKAEECASSNLIADKYSTTRDLRFELFRWPEPQGGLLAILQYEFAGANPPMSCPSLGLLVHLARAGATWKLNDEYLLETVHHSSLRAIRMLDLNGDGIDELVVESDLGGAGSGAINLKVFDLQHAYFNELLSTESMLRYMDEQGFDQSLDPKRTLKSAGKRFCFEKKMLFENGAWFKTPRITHPCYERRFGVDPEQIRERNQWLK